MVANANLISCNFSALPLKNQNLKTSLQPHNSQLRVLPYRIAIASGFLSCFKPFDVKTKTQSAAVHRKGRLHICHSSLNERNLEKESEVGGGNGNGGQGRNWTTSILLFLLWAALMYYVFFLTPNQTPVC